MVGEAGRQGKRDGIGFDLPVVGPTITGMKRLGVLALLLLGGCAGTMTSSVPIYPPDWPSRVGGDDATACPDLSGTYCAVSEPAAPLVYPPGGAPKESVMFVPYATAKAPAALGRRNLAWHLASRFDKNEPLARFAVIADGQADAAWVRLTAGNEGVIKIMAGVKGETLVSFDLVPRNRRKSELWNYQPGYTCRQGKLLVRGGFPVPKEEQQYATKDPFAAGLFTFERAEDGSLVMLEDLYWSQGAEISFQKWWRWRRLSP
jgi:hypothetical protein